MDDGRNSSKRPFYRQPAATVSIISWNHRPLATRNSFGEGRQTRGGVVMNTRMWLRVLVDAMLNHQRDWLEFLSGEPSF